MEKTAPPKLLHTELSEYGIDENLFSINVPNTETSDQDPEIIFVD